MQLSPKAHSFVGVFFIAAVMGGSVLNLYIEGSALQEGMATLPPLSSLDGFREACRRADALVQDNLAGKHRAWAAHAWLHERLGKSEMNGFSVIKAPDGRLYRGGLFPVQTGDADKLVGDIADLAGLAREKEAAFLYLGTPGTILLGADHLPESMPFNDYNVVLDSFLYGLREKNVPFLDSRFAFLSHGFPAGSIAPKTGFALSGEAAFALFTYLVDGLEQRFSVSLDPDGFYRNPDNYEFEKHPDFSIGQLGKETGPAFSGLDGFTAVNPKFETAFTVESLDMFGKTAETEGDARETLLHPDALVYYKDLYSLYPEGYYVHTNSTWSRVVNRRNPDGPRVLIIHDFQTAQLVSHLAPLFSEVHTLASHENLSTNAVEYLRDNDIDLVLVSFFPQNLLLPGARTLIGSVELPSE